MPFPHIETRTGADQIHERNGIWVVTINGVWLGDYTQHEHAVAAVNAVGHDNRPSVRQ